MSAPVRVEKQDIHIVVDPQTQKISGYTEIEFSAMTRSPPPVLFLNARQMNVTAVSIDGQPAKYTFIDSHRALDFNQQRDGRYARDATYFAAICQVVLESPDLVIELGGAKFPVVVRVDFDVHEDSTAIMRENDTILTDNWANGPSSWFPCVDTRTQRSMFTLWVTYSEEFVAVGPGESLHRKDAQTRTDTMMFRIPFPVTPSAVGFCLGRFSSEPLENSNPNGSTGVMYFLDNRDTFKSTMKAMPDIMNAAMELFDYDDVPVFPRMHFVSVPFLPDLRVFPSVCLIPPHMMLPEGNVNVVPTVVPLLVEAIVSQYILFLFPVADPTREWWQTGFVLYFSDVIVSKFYSRSWFLDRRWNDINFLYEEDIHPSFVLRAIDPTTGEPYHDPYLRIKAKLLVTMIAQSMQSRSDKQLTVNLINALKYSESESNFGSDDFLEDIFKFCPAIIEEKFNQQWLSRSGMPVFTYNYKKDTRGKTVKVVLFQQSSVSGTTKRRKDSDQKKDDPDVFTGKMVIQLLDMQQPIESYVQIEKQLHQFQLQFYAKKYKKRKVNFKFQDGTSMDVGAYDPVIWIILDPKPTWICRIRGKLPEYMLEYQLKLRRDAFAQHEVIGEMEDFCQTENSLKSLEDLISNPEYWWGVRCHAARAMARFNSDGNSSTHMQKLIEWYKRNFYEASNVPKPHDFHDVPTHYVQLEVIKSLSIIREGNNVTPSVLIDMFLQIAGSSNTRNMYNDDAFTAEVELALGRVIFTDQIKFTRAWEDVESKINLYSANTRLEGAVVAAAGYEALTGMTLKCYGLFDEEYQQKVLDMILRMRKMLLQPTPYCQTKKRIFKCLLYLALYIQQGLLWEKTQQEPSHILAGKLSFADLISDVRRLVEIGKLRTGAAFMRCMYRFVLNSVTTESQDYFKAFLLAIPASISQTKLKRIVSGREPAIAETIWVIMTRYGKNYRMLRSESFRFYTTLYGTATPEPFKRISCATGQVGMSNLVFERHARDGEFCGSIVRAEQMKNTSTLRPNPLPFPNQPPRASDKRSDRIRDHVSPPRIPPSRSYETSPDVKHTPRPDRLTQTTPRPIDKPRNPLGATTLLPNVERKPFVDTFAETPRDVPHPTRPREGEPTIPKDMSVQPLDVGGKITERRDEKTTGDQRTDEFDSRTQRDTSSQIVKSGHSTADPTRRSEKSKESVSEEVPRTYEGRVKDADTVSERVPETRSKEPESKMQRDKSYQPRVGKDPSYTERPREEPTRPYERPAEQKKDDVARDASYNPKRISGKGPRQYTEKPRTAEEQVRPYERTIEQEKGQRYGDASVREPENQTQRDTNTQKPRPAISGKGPRSSSEKPREEPTRPYERTAEQKKDDVTRDTGHTFARISGKGPRQHSEKPQASDTRVSEHKTEPEVVQPPRKPVTDEAVADARKVRIDQSTHDTSVSREKGFQSRISGKGPRRYDDTDTPRSNETPKPARGVSISGKGPRTQTDKTERNAAASERRMERDLSYDQPPTQRATERDSGTLAPAPRPVPKGTATDTGDSKPIKIAAKGPKGLHSGIAKPGGEPSARSDPPQGRGIVVAGKRPKVLNRPNEDPERRPESQPPPDERKEETKSHKSGSSSIPKSSSSSSSGKSQSMHSSHSMAPVAPSRKSEDKSRHRRDRDSERDRDRDDRSSKERRSKDRDRDRERDRDRGRDRDSHHHRSDRDRDRDKEKRHRTDKRDSERDRSSSRDDPARKRNYEDD